MAENNLNGEDFLRVRIHWMKVCRDIWIWVLFFVLFQMVYWISKNMLGRLEGERPLFNLLVDIVMWVQLLLPIIAILYYSVSYYHWKKVKYYVTKDRILIKKFSKVNVVALNQDEAFSVSQKRWGFQKWFGYGTLEVYDPQSNYHFTLDYVENPYGVVDRVRGKFRLVDEERSVDEAELSKPSDLFEEVEN